MLKSNAVNKIPFLLRAVIAMLGGIGIVIIGSLIARGAATWQACLGTILLLIGLPITVIGVLLLMREQFLGGVTPGTYYTYACPHCAGTIHSHEALIQKTVSCPYCGKDFTPQ